jgi:hypothetical protein
MKKVAFREKIMYFLWLANHGYLMNRAMIAANYR